MSTQIDSLGLYNNPYALNYQNNTNAGMNDDFLAQQLFAQQAGVAQTQPAFQGYQQPQSDTFQKSGSSGLSTGLKLATVGGLGTGAGMYFFGTNPVKDGKFNENILKAVDIDVNEVSKNRALEILHEQKAKIFQNVNIPEGINMENIKTYAETGVAPQELKNAITQDKAKALYEEVKKIDLDKIATQAREETIGKTLEGSQNKLAKLQAQKAKLESLADDANLEKFFKENASTFDIKGDEAAIEAEAKKLAGKYTNKAAAVADFTSKIDAQENFVKTTRESLNSKVAAYYDDATKSLKASAPENIKNAFKNFKWKTAGKWGAIAAGVGLVLGCLFGGSNKA